MKPKLILLYGFAGIGKSTLSRMYIDKHPLTLLIEGDLFIDTIGCSREHYATARKLVFAYNLALCRAQLSAGYDVIIPYLLVYKDQPDQFMYAAKDYGAEFVEAYIEVDKVIAINRLKARGSWGEKNSPKLDEKELIHATELFDKMAKHMKTRQTRIVKFHEDNIEKTYQSLEAAIG